MWASSSSQQRPPDEVAYPNESRWDYSRWDERWGIPGYERDWLSTADRLWGPLIASNPSLWIDPHPKPPTMFTGPDDPLLANAAVYANADHVTRDDAYFDHVSGDPAFMAAAAEAQAGVSTGQTNQRASHVLWHRKQVGGDLLHNHFRGGFKSRITYNGALPISTLARPPRGTSAPRWQPPARPRPLEQHRGRTGMTASTSHSACLRVTVPWYNNDEPLPPELISNTVAQDTASRFSNVPPDEDGDPFFLTPDACGWELVLPHSLPTRASIFDSGVPLTYVSTNLAQFNSSWAPPSLCPDEGQGHVLLAGGVYAPYTHIYPQLDFHFMDGRNDNRLYVKRLYNVPVVSLPLDRCGRPADKGLLCVGNDILDSMAWSLHPHAEFDPRRDNHYGPPEPSPFTDPRSGSVLQVTPPECPGLLLMLPVANVRTRAIPSDSMLLSPAAEDTYRHRLASCIAYTCLPFRVGAYSVMAELELWQRRADDLIPLLYESDHDHITGRDEFLTSPLMQPRDPSDILRFPFMYPRDVPLPNGRPLNPVNHAALPWPQLHGVPRRNPPRTLRPNADRHALLGTSLRLNERARRELRPEALYSTSNIRVGWYVHGTAHTHGRKVILPRRTLVRWVPYAEERGHPMWRHGRYRPPRPPLQLFRDDEVTEVTYQ